jgi:thiol:disulfide interchange protein DsbD
MKLKNIFLIALMVLCSAGYSQILKPVKWTFSSAKVNDSIVNLNFKATIDKGWHVYSQFINTDAPTSPVPTTFVFDKSSDYKRIGSVYEPKGIEEYDPNFEMKLKYFENTVTLTQQIKILSTKAFTVKGSLNYMCCNDKSCLPPEDVEFSFKLDGYAKAAAVKAVDTASTVSKDSNKTKKADSTKTTVKASGNSGNSSGISLWLVFLFSLFPGFLAIFTPCVFPMVPMTVSFFLKGSENKRKARFQATVYGLSIVFIYTFPIAMLVGIAMLFGKGAVATDFFNWLSTHWVPNTLFFLIFLFFAASFLGMFEIVLPSKLVNKMDSKADKGGILGPFFMAFVLVLVSFSCTGPIVGAVVVESSAGDFLHPIVAMLGFSVAFALPFALFAYFPSLLSNMPKSGGWMNSVKVVLGFLELALGLKFLSVADQTYHWRILDREVYLAFWIVIFFLMALYLLGKLKLAHDSDTKFLSVPRLILAIIVFTFVMYMIPGMFGAPLKALSGWLPPETTQDFDIRAIVREEVANASIGGASSDSLELCEKPKFSDFLTLPHGLKGYFDYEQGLACAKSKNKPVFLDFTGHGCVNCRKMEENVWSDPKVLKILKEKYIIITLYVDDKKELPESEWVTSKLDGGLKKTIGKKYADFQATRFNINAQPYYVLLDTKGDTLGEPKAYDPDIDDFVGFLEKGLRGFAKRSK